MLVGFALYASTTRELLPVSTSCDLLFEGTYSCIAATASAAGTSIYVATHIAASTLSALYAPMRFVFIVIHSGSPFFSTAV